MNTKTLMYILKRILLALLTVWVVITVTFFVMHAVPGGPFLSEKAVSEATQKALEAKYGLDKPVMEQYVNYLKDIVTKFDFGPSIKLRGRQVVDVIADGMKTSIKLGLIAAAIALCTGIVLGCVAALTRNSILDKIIMVITTAFVSMPSFIMGTLLLLIFSVKLGLVPANGESAKGLLLPIITLSLYPMAYITRLTRSSMLDVLGQDYIRTAKAKGIPQKKVVFVHALRNAMIPLLTQFGTSFGGLLGGAIITEQVFVINGLGTYLINAINTANYPVVQSTVLVIATMFVLINLAVDLIYCLVDPRVKYE